MYSTANTWNRIAAPFELISLFAKELDWIGLSHDSTKGGGPPVCVAVTFLCVETVEEDVLFALLFVRRIVDSDVDVGVVSASQLDLSKDLSA